MANQVVKHNGAELQHFGIPGMKWGRRRFQNPDGTRTSAGKKRDAANGRNEPERPKRSDDHNISRQAKKKGLSGLSNDELKKLNERLKLEKDFENLTAEKVEKAESWVKNSVKSAAGQAVTEFTKGVFLGGAKMLVNELSPNLANAAGWGKKSEPVKVKKP